MFTNLYSLTIVTFTIVCLASGQYYSSRTKCSQNRLSFDSQIANFYQNTQFSGVNISQVMDVMGMIKKLYHYGKFVNQSTPSNHRCQKYFLQADICCRYVDLDAFTDKMVDLYKRTYFKSRHPIIDYMFRIYDQYKAGNSSCLSNFDLKIPDRNTVVYANATSPLGDLFKKIDDELTQIKQFQLDFIYNSACLLCVGIQDFKTFLHPVSSNLNLTKRLIYNQDYFSNATNFIATRMLNCKNHSDQIDSFISNQIKPKLSSNTDCTTLSALINNVTEISKRKVCDTWDQCLKFAQKYIGGPAAPAYSKVFSSVQQKRGITKTNYKLVTSTAFGFKGNQTYARYIGDTVPFIVVKGNDYTYA